MINEMATLLNARQVEMTACFIKSFDEISNESKEHVDQGRLEEGFHREVAIGNLKAGQTRQHSRSISLLEVDRGETE